MSDLFTPETNTSETLATIESQLESGLDGSETEASEQGDRGTVDAETSEGSSVESPEKPVESKPLPNVEDLQKLAKEGEFEKVLERLGIDPKGVKVPSSRFAELRKFTVAEKAKIEARRQEVEARDAEVRRLIDETVKQHEPFEKARQLREKGDTLGALQAAFGEDFATVIEEALSQQSGKDPELLAMRRREELRNKKEAEQEQAAQQRKAAERQAQEDAQGIQELGAFLLTSGEPHIAAAQESLPGFTAHVFRLVRDKISSGKHRGEDVTELAQQSATEAWGTLIRTHELIEKVRQSAGGRQSTENTARAGKSPSNTDPAGRALEKKPRKGLSRAPVVPTKAVEEMSYEEARDYFAQAMKTADD